MRYRLQAGPGPEEVSQIKADVRSLLQTVEEICARQGAVPDQLPGPSRLAYRFLKEVAAGQIPIRQASAGGGLPEPRLGLRNVVRLGDHFADRFWDELALLTTSADARKALQTEVERHVGAIEDICARQNAPLSALETRSRQAYCWLKFLMDEANLAAHLAALERAKAALRSSPPTAGLPVSVHLLNLGSALWRKRQYTNVVLLKVSEGFLNADSELWNALVKALLHGPDETANRVLREFGASEDYSEILGELESFAEPTGLSAKGCVHNLEESFNRVNAACFRGAMTKPRLVWNQALTGRKFGHYRPSTDTVMLSVSLDALDVPAWVVDCVVYHELLHKKHGITLVNGRRLAHTAAFRAEERQFAQYQEAERRLNELARKHR